MTFCTNCGVDVTGANFCANCGTGVSEVAAAPTETAAPAENDVAVAGGDDSAETVEAAESDTPEQSTVGGQSLEAAVVPSGKLAITAFAFAVLSIILVAVPSLNLLFGFIGFALSLAAVTQKARRGLAIVSIVIVSVACVWSIEIIRTSGASSSGSSVSQSRASAAPKAPPAAPKVEVPWYPSGYTELASGVAYKSLPVEDMNCGYSSRHTCYQMYVTTQYGCEVFVNVNFLIDGVIVDEGIDSKSVPAGGQALMSFVSFTASRYSGDGSVKFTEVNCF